MITRSKSCLLYCLAVFTLNLLLQGIKCCKRKWQKYLLTSTLVFVSYIHEKHTCTTVLFPKVTFSLGIIYCFYCMENVLFFFCFMKQMPHGDGRLQNHNVSYMHTYCPGASYLPQGLSSSACVPPIFSVEDNTNSCAQTLGTSE